VIVVLHSMGDCSDNVEVEMATSVVCSCCCYRPGHKDGDGDWGVRGTKMIWESESY